MYDTWRCVGTRYSYGSRPTDSELGAERERVRALLLREIPVPAPSTFEQIERITRAGHLFSWSMKGWSSHAARMSALTLRQNATGF
jgi:hypothetical protein